jgi:hypothetical protein
MRRSAPLSFDQSQEQVEVMMEQGTAAEGRRQRTVS